MGVLRRFNAEKAEDMPDENFEFHLVGGQSSNGINVRECASVVARARAATPVEAWGYQITAMIHHSAMADGMMKMPAPVHWHGDDPDMMRKVAELIAGVFKVHSWRGQQYMLRRMHCAVYRGLCTVPYKFR